MQIADRFGTVTGAYSADVTIQVEAFDTLARRVTEQVEAIAPTVEQQVEIALAEWQQLQAWVAYTTAQLKALPEIDLSNIVPDLTFPSIRLIPINIDWDIPNVPIIADVARGIQSAVQGLANTVNLAFSTLATQIANGFSTAIAPLKQQLVANVMAQLQPYLDAYANARFTMNLARAFYDGVWTKLDAVKAQLDGASQAWQQIADDFGDQLSVSIGTAATVPQDLDSALGDSAVLLALFGIVTLGLFLLFYWARMMTDLLRGWQLMLGRYDSWKAQNAEPKEPLTDRWLARLEARKASPAA
ncbi:MAG: hypothetical protein R3F55_07290 [Alphaproteobacteria bacterium]